MKLQSMLSSCLLATALIATPLTAAADPAPVAAQSMTTHTTKAAATSDAERYAALEKQTPATAKFEGGGEAIYIGGSVLTVVLILLLIVIIL